MISHRKLIKINFEQHILHYQVILYYDIEISHIIDKLSKIKICLYYDSIITIKIHLHHVLSKPRLFLYIFNMRFVPSHIFCRSNMWYAKYFNMCFLIWKFVIFMKSISSYTLSGIGWLCIFTLIFYCLIMYINHNNILIETTHIYIYGQASMKS